MSEGAQSSRPPGSLSGSSAIDGFTLVEVLLGVLLSALLLTALSETVRNTLNVHAEVVGRQEQIEAARFAMERMIRAVEGADRLFVPQVDRAITPYDESDRDPGVLGISLDRESDRDLDGVPDADNDGDGRFDEDPGGDLNFDLAEGIKDIDDDNDGLVDEPHVLVWNGSLGPANEDDDEDNYANEDGWDGSDDDFDGLVDEDPKKDMSGEGLAGEPGFDDDGDGSIDEGDKNDDDEDGAVDEDWVDTVVFHQQGSDLIERIPVPWDVDASGDVNGADYLERVIATDVTQFRVRRVSPGGESEPVVEIWLSLAVVRGAPVVLQTKVQLGAAR